MESQSNNHAGQESIPRSGRCRRQRSNLKPASQAEYVDSPEFSHDYKRDKHQCDAVSQVAVEYDSPDAVGETGGAYKIVGVHICCDG